MTVTAEMTRTFPGQLPLDESLFVDAIDALLACEEACTACADSCLSEMHVDTLRRCIRTNMDCADVCGATARVLSRHTGATPGMTLALVEACLQACQSCAGECAMHADMHEHCRVCETACRTCAEACRSLLNAMREIPRDEMR